MGELVRPSLHERLTKAVPAGATGRRLVALALVDAVGTGTFLAISVIFLTRSVGLTMTQVGTGLAIGAGVGLLASVPLGVAADRIGVQRVLVVAYLWRAAGFATYAFIQDAVAFFVIVIAMGVFDKVLGPLAQALVSQAVEEDGRVRTMAVMGSVRNAGFSAGALIGGLALIVDTRVSYAAAILFNAATFVVMAAIVGRIPLLRAAKAVRRRVSWGPFADRPYVTLAGLNAVLTLHMSLLSIGIPAWVASRTSAPPVVLSALLVTNTLLVVVLQVWASRGAENLRGAARLLRRGGASIAVCCVFLMLTSQVPVAAAIPLLFAAIVALTMGEMYQSAGGWGVSYRLAPEDDESSYLTVFWLGAGAQQIIAPLLVAVIVALGPLSWLGVAGGVALAGLAVPPVVTWALSGSRSARNIR